MKKSYEQLNLLQRTRLQALLKIKSSLSDIAKEMNVSRQTLYRELMRNSTTKNKDEMYVKYSCANYLKCKGETKTKYFECPPNCIGYSMERPKCLKKYPFVCNFCTKKYYCKFLQRYYDAEIASSLYHEKLSFERSNPHYDKKTIKKIDKIVSPLVNKGQSVEAILMNHPEIKVSSITLRSWINKRILSCSPTNFRLFGRKTSSKEDSFKLKEHQRLSIAKLEHKYNDYRLYLSTHPNSLVIQLDSVIGTADGNTSVLTIHIVQHKFQFGLVLKSHSKEEVYNKLSELFLKLKSIDFEFGTIIYPSFSEVLLTDNGIEFDSLLDFCNDDPNIHVFFCNPLASFQKGACERNHVLIRYIHFKGWSFDNFSQDNVNLLFSHINSYPRKSLSGLTPFESVLNDPRLGKEFLDVIDIFKVNPDDVTLNPSLLKKVK